MLFRHRGILPLEAGRQNPFVLFRLLDDIEGESASAESVEAEINMSEHLRMFYGR